MLYYQFSILMSFDKYKQLGKEAFQRKDYKSAESLYTKALEYSQSDATVYFNLALVCYNEKRFKQSFEHCNRALEINPDYNKARYKRIFCAKQLGNIYQAYVDCKYFLEIEVENKQNIEEITHQKKLFKKLINQEATQQKLVDYFKYAKTGLPPSVSTIQQSINVDGITIQHLQGYLQSLDEQISSNFGTQNTDLLNELERIKKLVYQKLYTLQTLENKLEILDYLQINDPNKYLAEKFDLLLQTSRLEQTILCGRSLYKTTKNEKVFKQVIRIKAQLLNKIKLNQEEENMENPESKMEVEETKPKKKVKDSSIDQKLDKISENEQIDKNGVIKKQTNQKILTSVEQKIVVKQSVSNQVKKTLVQIPQNVISFNDKFKTLFEKLNKKRDFKYFFQLIQLIEQSKIPLQEKYESLKTIPKSSFFGVIKTGIDKEERQKLIQFMVRTFGTIPAQIRSAYAL